MKKIMIYSLLLIDIIGIFLICFVSAKNKANHCGAVIEIPEGMQLTVNNNVSVDDEEILILSDTVIVPQMIQNDAVYFYDDKSNKIVFTEFQNFKEQALLDDLQDYAEQKKINDQKKYMRHGIILGCVFGICWLGIEVLLSCWLVNKKRIKALFVFCISSSVIIYAIMVFSIIHYGHY